MEFFSEYNRTVTILTVIICFVSLVIGASIIFRALKKKPSPKIMIDSILILGLASFAYPAFRLIIALHQVATTVQNGGEMSVSLNWSGIYRILPTITIGLIALCVSIICWFVVRRFNVNNKK